MSFSLLKNFSNITFFDVETTGVDYKRDEIIEIAMLRSADDQGLLTVAEEFDALVKLSPGKTLHASITNLTGITGQQLLEEGLEKEEACEKLSDMLSRRETLLVAYNAQFDLCFIYSFLNSFGKARLLKGIKMLDMLTVYKDRKPYPHKLSDAALAYSLDNQSSHRAMGDTRMVFELFSKMAKESDDLERYVNLFGYNPKYGISGPKISSVRYMPQAFGAVKKLYEQ